MLVCKRLEHSRVAEAVVVQLDLQVAVPARAPREIFPCPPTSTTRSKISSLMIGCRAVPGSCCRRGACRSIRLPVFGSSLMDGYAAAQVAYAVALLRAAIVGAVTLAEGARIHEEDGHFGFGIVFPGHDRFLGGVHAAHGRAIIVLLVARADALQERDLARRLSIRWPDDVPLGGSGGAEQALELERRDYVRIAAPAKFFRQLARDRPDIREPA